MNLTAYHWKELSLGNINSIESENGVTLHLPPQLYCFYCNDDLGEDGFPQNGSLWEDGSYDGKGICSIFDVTAASDAEALLIQPEDPETKWNISRTDGKISLELASGKWECRIYHGNEPEWKTHGFPFRNLPTTNETIRHACVRGLLDFLAGSRRSVNNGVVFQSPNTAIGKGYSGDGIPDTFFQFCSVYPLLSEKRKAYFRSQLNWLGDHIRFDGCIPWGGCRLDQPYYHLWKRIDCGMFFDANGMWLEMNRLLYRFDNILPDPVKIIRAADFYLHYMTENGLVAAESKQRGCEWADFLQNGWHSSLINVLAYRGLDAAAELMNVCKQTELASRYQTAAARLKKNLNRSLEQGGLFSGTGFADWRDPDGTVHDYWRIDTNMLACVWDVFEPENADRMMRHFLKKYFEDEPAVPAPYLLRGAWFSEQHDDTLEETRSYGGGRASMPGRMGGPLVASLYKTGNKEAAEHILKRLCDLICHEPALWEYYDHEGKGYFNRSYIEHSLAVLYALSLIEINSINIYNMEEKI